MVSLLESEAVFQEKCREFKLPADSMQALQDQGINTLGTLAFSLGNPGDSASTQELRELLSSSAPQDVPLGVVASLRRLLFVAHTLAISEIKGMVEEPGAEAGVKELPMAERVSRINEQKQRLAGRSLVGDAECGHCCLTLHCKWLRRMWLCTCPRPGLSRDKRN